MSLLIILLCYFSVAGLTVERGVCLMNRAWIWQRDGKGLLRVSYRAAAKERRERTEGAERCGTSIHSHLSAEPHWDFAKVIEKIYKFSLELLTSWSIPREPKGEWDKQRNMWSFLTRAGQVLLHLLLCQERVDFLKAFSV